LGIITVVKWTLLKVQTENITLKSLIISPQIIPTHQISHICINNIPKEINILTVKNKLKRNRLEKYLECESNAQKDKRARKCQKLARNHSLEAKGRLFGGIG